MDHNFRMVKISKNNDKNIKEIVSTPNHKLIQSNYETAKKQETKKN